MGRWLKIFICLLSLSTVACEVTEPKDPNTLLYHLNSEPDTLNLLTATDAYAGRINDLLFDSLIKRNKKSLEFEPKVARSWEISDDQQTYTFHLRQDVQWHDGKPLTADDVIFTFERIMDEKVDAPHLRVYYKDIAKVEKIDDFTVRFTYAVPYFKALEFVGGIPILPKHIFSDGKNFNSHPANRAPIGNGPYRFVEWKTGKHILLERNENYWDHEHIPALKKILFKVVPDDTVTLQTLKKGDLDLASLRPIQWVRQTDSEKFQKNFVKHQYYTPSYRYIAWNLRNPLFQDKRVRKALAHLINRQAVVDKLEFGLGKITTGPFWVFGYEYNHKVPPIEFNPQEAKRLLEEAGWVDENHDGIREKDGKKFEFELLIPAGADFYVRLASILKKDFAEAGIELKIRTMAWATFVQQINSRKFDAVSLAWSFGFDEDPYQVWHSSQSDQGSNFVGFKNTEADQIMTQARQTFDKRERAQLYQRLHEILYEEQPYAFLYTGPALVARNRRFTHVEVYKGGLDILEWKVSKD